VQVTDLGIVGDSIISRTMTAYNYGQIRASGGRGAYIEGVDGVGGLEAVNLLAPTILPGGWLVVELGINDIASGMNVRRFGNFVKWVASILPDDRCLAWVLPWSDRWAPESAAFGVEIKERILAQPCHATVPWADVVQLVPGLLLSDDVHATARGGTVLAGLIYGTVGK
jgi:lysophospholipase L1-like esterase